MLNAASALHTERSSNDILFEQTNDLVLQIDPASDVIIDANPIACARLGCSREELLKSPASMVFENEESYRAFVANLLFEGQGVSDIVSYRTLSGEILPAHLCGASVVESGRTHILLVGRAGTGRSWAEDVLRAIAQGVSSATGETFFRALVRNVAQELRVRFTYITEFVPGSRHRVRAIACWNGDRFGEPFEYDLEGTPCEAVLNGELRFYARDVRSLFPRDRALESIDAQSFLAVPLVDESRGVIGHLAIFHDAPMAADTVDLSIFKIFAARAAGELKHKHAREALLESEQRISGILSTAMDAIVTIDSSRHITLFNRAAEKMFRCNASWAIGQPFDRLFSKPFRLLVSEKVKEVGASNRGGRQLWAPEGFTAKRADGEVFPIDATISPLDIGTSKYFTVILRDVGEREKAKSEMLQLRQDKGYLEEEVAAHHDIEGVVAMSAGMEHVFKLVHKVAATDSTVLLLGETGTGKELMARALHRYSRRVDRLFVTVNCAALPSELIESELFGHEKGSFTGATQQRKGRFEVADGGTLFLDEVGELSLSAQAKLLRVLQTQTFERVGGVEPITCDARVVAATNRNLGELVNQGGFRSDLYYRLNVFPVMLPALRERPEDIVPLARHFLAGFARTMGKSLDDLSETSVRWLEAYSWPGNVRELRNLIERAVILASGSIVEIGDSIELDSSSSNGKDSEDNATLESVERTHIAKVLEQTAWVLEGKRGAAAVLGVHPNTLRYRLKKLGLKRPIHN